MNPPDIADREGWKLDLTSDAPPRASGAVPGHLDRYIQDTNAANAAVVLARTQATAARAEARDLSRQVRTLSEELAAERGERERAEQDLRQAARDQAVLERDHAVAVALAEELRRQLDQERSERTVLSARIGVVGADREEAVAAMGWWSRRRYLRRRAGDGPPVRPDRQR